MNVGLERVVIDEEQVLFSGEELYLLQRLVCGDLRKRRDLTYQQVHKAKMRVANKFGDERETLTRKLWRATAAAVGKNLLDLAELPGMPEEKVELEELRLMATMVLGVGEVDARKFLGFSKKEFMKCEKGLRGKAGVGTSYALVAWAVKNREELGLEKIFESA